MAAMALTAPATAMTDHIFDLLPALLLLALASGQHHLIVLIGA